MVKPWMNSMLVIFVSCYCEIIYTGMVHIWWRCLFEVYEYMHGYVYCDYVHEGIVCEVKCDDFE